MSELSTRLRSRIDALESKRWSVRARIMRGTGRPGDVERLDALTATIEVARSELLVELRAEEQDAKYHSPTRWMRK